VQGRHPKWFLKATDHRRKPQSRDGGGRQNGGNHDHGYAGQPAFLSHAGEHPVASAPRKVLIEYEQSGNHSAKFGQAIESIGGCLNAIAGGGKVSAELIRSDIVCVGK